MKLKTFLAMATIAALAACKSTYRATDSSVVVTSSSAEAAFHMRYPGAENIEWTRYEYNPLVVGTVNWDFVGWTTLDRSYAGSLVRFDQGGEHYYAWYDENGYWTGTAILLKDYTLPAAVTNTLSIRFPAYDITGLSRVSLANMMAYEVELHKHYYTARVLIDDNGNVINQRVKSY